MDILGLIPARGGSKSIPHKNVALLAGRPLLAYTCEAALGSRKLTRTILSSDDDHIVEVARECGIEAPFRRPADLARDETLVVDVIQHALRWLRDQERFRPEVIVLLQPTSPLRDAGHIDEALDVMAQTGAETVVSVVDVPHHYNPVSVMTLEDGWLRPFLAGEGTRLLRRQDKPRVYARNGPAVLAMRTSVIEKEGKLYGDLVAPYAMDWVASIDIDTPFDLRLAEFCLRERNADS